MATLYLVGTPIGNLEDITLRAVRILGEVSLIAAEDTRRARILTQRYHIATPVTSYFEGNKLTKLEAVVRALGKGDVALISEAGMPGLSDPGYELIRAAIEQGHTVTAVPGPSAPITALVLSGLPSDTFLYLGFLPRRPRDRRATLKAVRDQPWTLVLFESPHRLIRSLTDMEAILGDRPIAICRELTKLHEEVWRGTVSGAREYFTIVKPRGEFTLVVGGTQEADLRWDEERVRAAMDTLRKQGVRRSQAARQVAADSGWSRSDVYALTETDDE